MLSSTLAIVLAASAAQASDTTRESREAFAACLRAFVDSSLEAQKSSADFEAEYPQACSAEQAAFRAAIIRRDTAARFSQADAEEAAGLEIEDARFNFSERFAMAVEAYEAAVERAAAQQAAAQQAAAQPAAQAATGEQGQAAEPSQPPSD